MESIEGKAALVTGSSRGIGRAVALELARRGADVAVNFRSREDLAGTAVDEIKAMGRDSLSVRADVGSREQCISMVGEVAERFGRLDILVNNAGIWKPSVIEEVNEDELRRMLRTNVEGAFYLAGEAVPYMKDAGWGRVVNMSSVIGVTGYQGDSMYAGTKAALIGFTRALAREVARYGITVNAVIPGFIETDMAHQIDDATRSKILKTIPIRRWGNAQEIAEAVVFLCESGSYVTGQLLTVDGGYTI